MKPRLIVVFAVLVLVPLAVIGWLGVRTTLDEQESTRRRFQALLASRLADVEQTISKVVERKERDLKRLADRATDEPSDIRELVRGQGGIQQIFVMDARGALQHPPPQEPRNQSEEAFLERTKRIFESKERFFRAADGGERVAARGVSPPAGQGWYTYYFGAGDHFIYWLRQQNGKTVGFDLDRIALLAEIVGELPATDRRDTARLHERIQLVSAQGEPVYVFGSYEPPRGEQPAVTRELEAPFGAWRLLYFVSDKARQAGLSGGAFVGTFAGLGALALAIFGLAFYFIRESGREAREARQRVTFVNQVSHELKTPLTNIRMYAELLAEQIDEQEEKSRLYLDVIVSESERLSRLIANVLSFARYERKKLTVRGQLARIDEVITGVVEQFRPGLEAAGFEISTRLHEEGLSQFDPDALGQIIGNLLGNAEKYAGNGRWVEITSYRRDETVIVEVTDRGPGVPAAFRKKIFEPFFRLSQRVSAGVSGTGIGLSISRELARLHGGDLRLLDTSSGARFELLLRAPLAEGETKP